MSNKSNSNSGVGTLGILGLIFITLKLTGNIDWSWWLVLLPFYGGVVFIAIIAVIWVSYNAYKKIKVK